MSDSDSKNEDVQSGAEQASEGKKPVVPAYIVASIVSALIVSLAVGIWFYLESGKDKRVEELDSGPVQVLMVGNSLLFYNDVPNMLRVMAGESRLERPVEIHSVAIPNFSLNQHLGQDKSSLELAASRKDWDFVVLQDRSDMPLSEPFQMLDSMRKFREKIDSKRTKFLLFMTWADEGETKKQKVISAVTRKMANRLGMEIVPAGDVFFAVKELYPDLEIFCDDGHHAGQTGSWLAASCILSMVTGRRPATRVDQLVFEQGSERIPMISATARQVAYMSELVWRMVKMQNRGHRLGLHGAMSPTSVLPVSPTKKEKRASEAAQKREKSSP